MVKIAAAVNGGKGEKRRENANAVQRETREAPLKQHQCSDRTGANRHNGNVRQCSGCIPGCRRQKINEPQRRQVRQALKLRKQPTNIEHLPRSSSSRLIIRQSWPKSGTFVRTFVSILVSDSLLAKGAPVRKLSEV
jgi:hypothetical protein